MCPPDVGARYKSEAYLGILSEMAQEAQIQDLIRTLNNLARELELLVDRTRSKPGSGDRKVESAPASITERGSEVDFTRHKALNTPVRLNVGGKVFPATWRMLSQVPETKLGKIAESRSLEEALLHCDGYNSARNEFYFNRRNKNFTDILEFYRTGSLHISDDCCVIAFAQDLQYWDISEHHMQTCCLKRFSEVKDHLDWDYQSTNKEVDDEYFPPGPGGRLQKRIWDLFEKPHTSIGARIIAVFSVLCIVVSTVILTLNTLPAFQNNTEKIVGDFWIFAIIEMVYMSWFTIEFCVRLISCPDKVKFFKKLMNWIDLLAIIPYFVTIIIYAAGWADSEESEVDVKAENANDVRRIAQFFRLLRIVKTLRIIRIFKLARHSTGLQALGHTMRSNYKELGLLILFLGMGAIMFSSLVYVFENDDKESSFRTMLDAYWWAIITMTTVGYGDVYPITGLGKVVGTLCAVFGVLVIGLPIPIIGSSFNNFYAREKRREKIAIERAKEGSSLVYKQTRVIAKEQNGKPSA